MQYPSARTLRGLSIAIVIISILAILGSLLSGMVLGASGVVAMDPDLQSQVSAEVQLDATSEQALEDAGLTTNDAVGIFGALMLFGSATFIVMAVAAVFNLIAGIIGLRAARDPMKAGGAKVWMIVGAVAGAIGLDPVTLILCIVGAVYAHKLKGEATNVIPYGNPQ